MTIEARTPAASQADAYVEQHVDCTNCSTPVEVTDLCDFCAKPCCGSQGCCEGEPEEASPVVWGWRG